MSKAGEQVVVIALAIIGVALLAVFVSRNSDTANVIKSFGNAFNNSLKAALAPVNGTGGF
jgi:hypothetical protein